MKRLVSVLSLACAMVSASFAVLVNPGSSALMPITGTGPTGTLIDSRADNFVGTNVLSQTLFTGTLYCLVYKEVSNDLTFYYKIANNSTSANALSKLAVSGFNGFTTDVDATMATGTNLPVAVDRLNPNSLAWTFATLPVIGGNGPLLPGTSSHYLQVKTNATAYAVNSASVIDGAVANISTFAPVPEPGTMAALGLGAAALIRRRKKA